MDSKREQRYRFFSMPFVTGLILGAAITLVLMSVTRGFNTKPISPPRGETGPSRGELMVMPRERSDNSGFGVIITLLPPWSPDASLEEVRDVFQDAGPRAIQFIDKQLDIRKPTGEEKIQVFVMKSLLWMSEGKPEEAYKLLEEARRISERNPAWAHKSLATVIYLQGVAALRLGENQNCIECRGESSCILPIAANAVHLIPRGSRLAIQHFIELLARFPDDLEVRWLLNVAHMTLGEYPEKVDPRYLIALDRWLKSEFDIGRFRDIGHLAGVNNLTQAGGAVMDDFDNDGRLDLAVTAFDAVTPMTLFRNVGDGKFEDRGEQAGLSRQLGGLVCYQTDYNNDGWLDILVMRGAWLRSPVRPTLLRNNQDGSFTDVTKEAGLMESVNSNSASWADYDNDGFLDLFIACEAQPNLLYHNRGDGTFEEVGIKARVHGFGKAFGKGSTWIDYDNDNYPDLFLNYLSDTAELYRNNHDGTFTEVTTAMGIDGPVHGFSCWSWDFDNDGWLDIFATCYDRSLESVIQGMLGESHGGTTSRLYRNRGGQGFEDVTRSAGLDKVYATMGSNFADFDNDGFLDMYLGTGEPSMATLIPNRMFKNVAGARFAEITASSGTGHLQKGHGVACGDWDRDGDIDIYIEMGGAVNGDKYHNILFQNPGQGNHWLTVKLVGVKTNRAAIGARVRVVTAGEKPLTVHRHVTSGSSFGANTLEQSFGLAQAGKVAELEIHWPTSGTTQVFRDIAADQAIEVTEFADDYRKLDWKPIALPE